MQAIIGTIGDIDQYQLPDAKGHTAFVRHLLGITDEERQTRREQVLATNLQDFRCGSFIFWLLRETCAASKCAARGGGILQTRNATGSRFLLQPRSFEIQPSAAAPATTCLTVCCSARG